MTIKYNSFISNLNLFIDKYYRYLLIKGIIIFLLLILLLFISVSSLEYFGWFSISFRRFFFFFFILSTGFIFYYYILIPILRLFGLLHRITHRHASELLNLSFPDIKDQIINVLELHDTSNKQDYSLLNASIEQKIDKLEHYRFSLAVKYKNNRGLLYYLFSILILFFLIVVFKPAVLKVGANRIIHYNQEFQKDIGYSINLSPSNLYVEKGKDLVIKCNLIGDVIPEQLFIKFGNNVYLLPSLNNSTTSYTFKSVNQSFSFQIFNEEFKSQIFKVEALNTPILKEYSIEVIYPEYLDRNKDEFVNLNEFSVPVGSELRFNFDTYDVDSILFIIDSTRLIQSKKSFGNFKADLLVTQSCNYIIKAKNFNFENVVLSGSVTAIPDFYPGIKVEAVADKFNPNVYYFQGLITDDYGFSKLLFVVNGASFFIPIQKSTTQQEFYYSYLFNGIEGDDFQFYFEVFDNDAYTRYKSTKSSILNFKLPDYKELLEEEKLAEKQIEEKIDKGLLLAKELQRDIDEIQKSLLQENLSDWDRKNQMDKLLQKNKQLEELVKEISKENIMKDSRSNNISEEQKDIIEKQKALQEMFDGLMSDELKELMKQIESLQKEFDQKKFNELTKDLTHNYEELSKELDKNLELLKRYGIEKQVSDISEQLDKLSANQDSLSKISLNRQADTANLKLNNQENISSLNELKNQYDSLLNENSELEKPMELNDLSNDFEEISQQMQQNSDQFSKDQKSASQKAKENSKKLKDLSEKMDAMMSNSNASQEGENAETIRILLENLFFISFKQESLIENFSGLNLNDPKFVALTIDQKQILSDFEIIRDSLYALNKRTSQIGVHISKTAFTVESNLIWAIEALSSQNFSLSNNSQRTALEKTNDLILLLSESLKNMDNMGSGSGGSNKKKKKPQKGQPSLSDMRKTQESMKQQMEKMLNDMKKSQSQGGQQYNEQMAKILAQQEVFQQMLNEMMNSQKGVGKETTKQLKEIQQMVDQNRRDIINKSIGDNTLQRQHQIVTRLLEAEKSEMERDLDEQRESKNALEIMRSNPENLFDDPNENANFNELLYQNNLNLQPFYKIKYQEYLKEINSLQNE